MYVIYWKDIIYYKGLNRDFSLMKIRVLKIKKNFIYLYLYDFIKYLRVVVLWCLF